MINDYIIVYTEGSLSLGLGNIYRSISLCDALLRQKDAYVEFVTSSEEYVRNIISPKYSVTFKVDQSSAFGYINQKKPNLVIVDYLGIESDFIRILKEHGIKVVIIGNNTDANNYADLVVNAIIGTNFENSNTLDKFGTRYLKGPKFLVLREEFERKRGTYRYKGKLENITLMFGGTDQANFSFKVLVKLIEESLFEGNIKIILGAGYGFKADIYSFIGKKSIGNRVSVLQNITNISDELLASDFILTSPGTSLFEAFSLGIPSLSFYQNSSQEDVFRLFYNVMKYSPKMHLTEIVLSVYMNIDDFRNNMTKLSVGMGRSEIINHLVNL